MNPNKPIRRKKSGWMAAPMILWSLIFVGATILYIIAISFMKPNPDGNGVIFQFTLENFAKLLQPGYLKVFLKTLRLGLETTLLCMLIGYPFGYFMARLSEAWKRRMMLFIMLPFWTSSLIRLYGWIIVFRSNGTLDKLLMGLGITDGPLKLLYTYPAVVVGMIYALLPFMILAVYSSAEKLDFTLVEASRDLGASASKAFWTVSFPLTLPGL
jgi:spermidine/putrescine transport system permease protein